MRFARQLKQARIRGAKITTRNSFGGQIFTQSGFLGSCIGSLITGQAHMADIQERQFPSEMHRNAMQYIKSMQELCLCTEILSQDDILILIQKSG
jgi:hypothetical protein